MLIYLPKSQGFQDIQHLLISLSRTNLIFLSRRNVTGDWRIGVVTDTDSAVRRRFANRYSWTQERDAEDMKQVPLVSAANRIVFWFGI